MPWKTSYEPAPPRGRNKKAPPGRVTATYTEGDYAFTHSDKVEPDDTSEVLALRDRCLGALAEDQARRAAARAVEAVLDENLNAAGEPPPPGPVA